MSAGSRNDARSSPCAAHHTDQIKGREYKIKKGQSGWLGGSRAHWSEISGFFLHGPSITGVVTFCSGNKTSFLSLPAVSKHHVPLLLPGGRDAPSLSTLWKPYLDKLAVSSVKSGSYEVLIDGAITNSHHKEKKKRKKSQMMPCRIPWQTLLPFSLVAAWQRERIYFRMINA